MDKNRCPKIESTKHFWENSTRTRYFAELFGTHAHDIIYAVVISKNKIGQKSPSRKIAISRQNSGIIYAEVPKTRILVFRENVSPFLGHPTLVPFFKLGVMSL